VALGATDVEPDAATYPTLLMYIQSASELVHVRVDDCPWLMEVGERVEEQVAGGGAVSVPMMEDQEDPDHHTTPIFKPFEEITRPGIWRLDIVPAPDCCDHETPPSDEE
jgi:hypothetical protein